MIATASPFRRASPAERICFSKHDLLVDVLGMATKKRATKAEFESSALRVKTILERRDGLLQILAVQNRVKQGFELPEQFTETRNPLEYLFEQSGLNETEKKVAILTLQGLTCDEISRHKDIDLTLKSVDQTRFTAKEKIKVFLDVVFDTLPNYGTGSLVNIVYFWLHTCVGKEASPELARLGKLFDLAELSEGEKVLAYLRLTGFTQSQIRDILQTSTGMVRIVFGQPLPLKFQLLLPEDDMYFPNSTVQNSINLEQLIVRVLHKMTLTSP